MSGWKHPASPVLNFVNLNGQHSIRSTFVSVPVQLLSYLIWIVDDITFGSVLATLPSLKLAVRTWKNGMTKKKNCLQLPPLIKGPMLVWGRVTDSQTCQYLTSLRLRCWMGFLSWSDTWIAGFQFSPLLRHFRKNHTSHTAFWLQESRMNCIEITI